MGQFIYIHFTFIYFNMNKQTRRIPWCKEERKRGASLAREFRGRVSIAFVHIYISLSLVACDKSHFHHSDIFLVLNQITFDWYRSKTEPLNRRVLKQRRHFQSEYIHRYGCRYYHVQTDDVYNIDSITNNCCI